MPDKRFYCWFTPERVVGKVQSMCVLGNMFKTHQVCSLLQVSVNSFACTRSYVPQYHVNQCGVFLKSSACPTFSAISAQLNEWSENCTMVSHPGISQDRGPHSCAILGVNRPFLNFNTIIQTKFYCCMASCTKPV